MRPADVGAWEGAAVKREYFANVFGSLTEQSAGLKAVTVFKAWGTNVVGTPGSECPERTQTGQMKRGR